MYYILDKNKNLVKTTPEKAFMFWEKSEERIVAKTEFKNNVVLSTVFLCIDHNFNQSSPLLFESLWFGGVLDGEIRRYHTWDEALAGHENWIDLYERATVRET